MAIWRDVIQSEEYQNLPLTQKWLRKRKFYNDTISRSDRFTSLSSEERNKIKDNFFLEKPEEGFKIKPLAEVLRGFAEKPVANIPLKKAWQGLKIADRPVEAVARFIEPETAEPGIKGVAKFFPRQMTAELVRAYKPSTLLPFLLATGVAKPILKPISKAIASKTPQALKNVLLKQLTVGKGQPLAYQKLAKQAQLSKLSGAREAEKAGTILSTAKEKIVTTPLKGKPIITKPGQPLSMEHQKYMGRIFRQEVDIGGKLSKISMPAETAQRMAKNIEIEVAFNPKIQKLNTDLTDINKVLRNKEVLAKGLVGKQFRTGTGFIEEVTGVSKVAKTLKSGKPSTKRFDLGLKSEALKPAPPTVSPIPEMLTDAQGNVVRGIKQISKAPTTNQFQNLSRQALLQKRKLISKSLQKETMDIELGVRANYSLFDRTFSEQIRTHPKYQQLSSIASEGRNIMDKWSKELVKSGITKENSTKIIEENVGQYMARMYKSKLATKKPAFNLFKDLRLRLNGLKHRKDLSVEVRNLMGEIKEPALPTAVRVKEISSSVANNKLFSQVAKNPEWTSAKELKGLVKMPDTPAVGALKGKWVIPQIAEDVNAITAAGQQAEGIYLKALQAWKFGKVVLNPAAQVRNVISNTILLDLSGTNHIRQAKLYPKAFKAFLSKNQIYNNALDDGAIGGEFVGGEIKKIQDFYVASQGGNLQKWANVAKYPFKKAADMYQGSEQISKLVKYMDVLEKGGTRQMAAEAAQKWLFNYNEIPNFIELARKSPFGAPFITFTYKALPRIGEALVERPLTVYKYKALFNAWNETSRKTLGMKPDEYAREQKALPPWLLKNIGGIPMNLLMPFRDKYGRTQYLNLEYIMPVGQAPEILERGIMRGGISNPLFNIIADLSRDKDFMGKPILPPEPTKAEAAQAATSYIYRQLAPNLAPAIPKLSKGGYSFEKIMDAVYQRPDYDDRTRDLTPTIMDALFGIKINALDVDESEMFKYYEKKKRIDALNLQILKLEHPAISEKERERKTEILFNKIQKVLDE